MFLPWAIGPGFFPALYEFISLSQGYNWPQFEEDIQKEIIQSLKLSYSCMSNVRQIIDRQAILKKSHPTATRFALKSISAQKVKSLIHYNLLLTTWYVIHYMEK